jgi:ATP-dependent Clp protease ATP-binding subunit ClpC
MAQEEAEKHRQGYIGPEHLLLGLLRVKTGFAATVLPSLGIDAAVVEAKLESPQDKSPIQRLIPTSRTKRVIETAFRLASDMQHRCVGTGHLLLGLITEADGATVAVFMEKEVTPDRIAAEVQRLQGTVGPED